MIGSSEFSIVQPATPEKHESVATAIATTCLPSMRIVCCLLLVVPMLASADVYKKKEPAPVDVTRWVGTFAFHGALHHPGINDAQRGVGFLGSVGLRFSNRMTLSAEYSLVSLTAPDSDGDTDGLSHGVAANLRWTAIPNVDRDLIFGFFVEGGVGRRFVNWNGDRHLHRNEFHVGVGYALEGFPDNETSVGVFFSARMFAAAAKDSAVSMAECRGCGPASSRGAVGLMFTIGFEAGKPI